MKDRNLKEVLIAWHCNSMLTLFVGFKMTPQDRNPPLAFELLWYQEDLAQGLIDSTFSEAPFN